MPSKYDVEVSDGANCVVIDVYEICRACGVGCGATKLFLTSRVNNRTINPS